MYEKLVKFTTFCYLITNSINYSFKVTFNKKVCPFFSPLQILIMYSRRNKLKNIKNKCKKPIKFTTFCYFKTKAIK